MEGACLSLDAMAFSMFPSVQIQWAGALQTGFQKVEQMEKRTQYM